MKNGWRCDILLNEHEDNICPQSVLFAINHFNAGFRSCASLLEKGLFMEVILTVVVPAYNAQNYLKNCLDSLCLPDLLDKMEIIVVNDGSTDQTGQLAEQYQKRYPHTVRVIHKENGGHGSGINCGIKAACGRYFKVVDADDWVDGDGFRNLMKFLEKPHLNSSGFHDQGPDVVVSGFLWAFDNGSGREETFPTKAEIRTPFSGVVYGKTYGFDQVADKIYVKMHGMTIRTDILKEHGIRVDENCFYVDTEYVLYPVPFIQTISFIRDFVYLYRIGRAGQSVDPAKMLRLQADYDRVLHSLFLLYKKCRAGGLPCSREKCGYLARMIARVAAGKVKILLSAPYGRDSRARLVSFEQGMKAHYPDIYRANQNKAIRLLRLSGYRLYPAAAALLHIKNRRG